MYSEGGLPAEGVVSAGRQKTIEIFDKRGEQAFVDYYKFPPGSRHPLPEAIKDPLMVMARKAFPNYEEQDYANLERKFSTAAAFDIVRRPDGAIIAFHIFKTADIEGYSRPLKVMYVDHAATDPEFEGRGITTRARKAIYDQEQPDIFCGSSANPYIYKANQKIAAERGWQFYPTQEDIPPQISGLAKSITEQMGITNAVLDERLVRTYEGPVSRGKGEHPLQAKLNLGPTQHVFYMGIKPEVAATVLTGV